MAQWLADGFARRRLPHPCGISELAVTTSFPSGLNDALATPLSWRRGLPMALPVAASHTRAVLSKLAVTTSFPSGLNDALATSFSWRRGLPMALPVAASHTRAVLSVTGGEHKFSIRAE